MQLSKLEFEMPEFQISMVLFLLANALLRI